MSKKLFEAEAGEGIAADARRAARGVVPIIDLDDVYKTYDTGRWR